jgi:hypothetical protein
VNPLSKGIVTSPLNDLKLDISIAFRYITIPHPENILRPYRGHRESRGIKLC